VELNIWNYNTLGWDLVDGSVYNSFTPAHTYQIGSDYYNSNFDIILKLNGTNIQNSFNFYLDQFVIDYVWTRTSGSVNADIVKSIVDPFINRYDGLSNYQKLYNITIEFDYTFAKSNSLYPDVAKFFVIYGASQDSFDLIKDGTPQSFSYFFKFDSSTSNNFDLMFNISNGLLELENMSYTLVFNSLDSNGNYLLQQDFEVNYPEEDDLSPFMNLKDAEFLIFSNYTLNTYFDGITYYNTNNRTDKLEIVFKIKANGQWFSSIYSTNISGNDVTSFNVSEFMTDNRLTIFQDFAVEYIIIGNNTDLTVYKVSLSCFAYNEKVQEFYRITDNDMGIISDWIEFNSSAIFFLDDLGDLPSNFSLGYKVIDIAGNVGINSTYNGVFKNIIYSEHVSVSLADDDIDLNSQNNREISFFNTGQFNNVLDLDVFINGFRYGTASLVAESYKLSFGTKNSKETLLAYSESLISDNIYSNINPLNRISWEIKNEDYFAAVKHVLAGDSITITNPLLYNSTRNLNLFNLYNTNFGLPSFVRMQEAFYYNITSGEKYVLLENIDYFVYESGIVDFSQYSIVHDLYNNISDVRDSTVYFTYYASEFRGQLRLSNADGFFINFTMPEVYYDHTTINKLTINFYDTNGQTYSKVLFDIDLRKYFLDDVKSQYEHYIFGLGRMMAIPLYIDINELDFSNPHNTFDLGLLESISFTIEDSQQWPGSFIQNFANYSVINLPY
ncbi:hypothetical protein LCGC14_2024840, partial [marine sediment metagenome]